MGFLHRHDHTAPKRLAFNLWPAHSGSIVCRMKKITLEQKLSTNWQVGHHPLLPLDTKMVTVPKNNHRMLVLQMKMFSWVHGHCLSFWLAPLTTILTVDTERMSMNLMDTEMFFVWLYLSIWDGAISVDRYYLALISIWPSWLDLWFRYDHSHCTRKHKVPPTI